MFARKFTLQSLQHGHRGCARATRHIGSMNRLPLYSFATVLLQECVLATCPVDNLLPHTAEDTNRTGGM